MKQLPDLNKRISPMEAEWLLQVSALRMDRPPSSACAATTLHPCSRCCRCSRSPICAFRSSSPSSRRSTVSVYLRRRPCKKCLTLCSFSPGSGSPTSHGQLHPRYRPPTEVSLPHPPGCSSMSCSWHPRRCSRTYSRRPGTRWISTWAVTGHATGRVRSSRGRRPAAGLQVSVAGMRPRVHQQVRAGGRSRSCMCCACSFASRALCSYSLATRRLQHVALQPPSLDRGSTCARCFERCGRCCGSASVLQSSGGATLRW